MQVLSQIRESWKSSASVITAGFALFAMFFGAGNLVFPLLIGRTVGSGMWYAIVGLGLTAVFVPFLGLAAMVLFQGNTTRFFGRLGRWPGFALFLLLQLVLGPFGVIPRLMTLMHAATKPYLTEMPLWGFSVLLGVVIFFCSIKRQTLIPLIGRVLTPIKLLSLAALIALGISGGEFNPVLVSAGESFLKGFFGGYHTMDLIAAFIFATLIFSYFEREAASKAPEHRQKFIYKQTLLSSLIAGGLLLMTYIGLVCVASYHAWQFDASFPKEEMLGAIASQILGPVGGCIAMLAVTFACLTTAITLSATFADYLRNDLVVRAISHNWALIATLGVAVFMANLRFSGLLALLGPFLQVVYPGLILLSVLNILHALYGVKTVRTPVFALFGITALGLFMSFHIKQ